MESSLIILKFTDGLDPDVGYIEGFHGAVYQESPQRVAACNDAFERLSEMALSPTESAALIDAAASR